MVLLQIFVKTNLIIENIPINLFVGNGDHTVPIKNKHLNPFTGEKVNRMIPQNMH